MYQIIQEMDGKFLAVCNILDGSDSETFTHKKDAVEFLIQSAKTHNGMEISAKDIKFGRCVQKVITDIIWENSCCDCSCKK